MMYKVTTFHNADARFMPYQDGHRLTAAGISHWLDLAEGTDPETIADWAWHTFNAGLDRLEVDRTNPDAELAFLAACIYRLLRQRSLSVGDVIEIVTVQQHWWLACDHFGWTSITKPVNCHRHELDAETIYTQMRTAGAGQ